MPPKKSKPKDESEKTAKKPEEKKSHSSGSLSEGDIITLDFDAYVVTQDGTEDMFDTTNAEHAKAGNIFNEKAIYEPIVAIIGDGRVLPGLDKSFLTATVGEKVTLSIPPSEGAGERLPNMVEIFSVRELQKQEIDPEPGMRVQIKNRVGTITNVTSGRVRVDFNDPLAGKTLKYIYTVHKKAETPEEKTLAIVESDFGRSGEFKVKVDGDALELTLSEVCKYNQTWFAVKYKIVGDLRKFLGFATIKLVEEYVKKEEPIEEEKPAEPAEPEESEVISESDK